MPHYFFHRLDGGFDIDREGAELKDAREARLEAILYAAGTVRDHPEMVWDGGEMRIEVTDDDGRVVSTVVVMSIDAQTPESIRKRVSRRS